VNHLSVARGSLKEVETLCTISENLKLVSDQTARDLEGRCESISRMLWVMRERLS
jgi:four helix bundle protein